MDYRFPNSWRLLITRLNREFEPDDIETTETDDEITIHTSGFEAPEPVPGDNREDW